MRLTREIAAVFWFAFWLIVILLPALILEFLLFPAYITWQHRHTWVNWRAFTDPACSLADSVGSFITGIAIAREMRQQPDRPVKLSAASEYPPQASAASLTEPDDTDNVKEGG